MPLTEQRRKQLDDIVVRMTQNKESEANIFAVVEDFKQKYGGDYPGPEQQSTQSLGQFGSNILKSGGRLVGDIAGAAAGLSPVGLREGVRVPPTVKALGGLAVGAAEKMIPGEQKQEQNVDAMIDFYAKRYGGLENLKKTAYEDPVGMLADFATLFTVAGPMARGVQTAAQAARLGKTASVAGRIGEAATRTARMVDPVQLATGAAGKSLRGTARLIDPKKIYRSALKPAGTTPRSLRAAELAVEGGLEEGIPLTMKGLGKTQDIIEDLQSKIDAIIPASRIVLKPKDRKLLKGPHMMPPPGSIDAPQTVLSKADISATNTIFGKFSEIPDFAERIKQIYTGESRSSGAVEKSLQEAKNAQFLQLINEEAEVSGILPLLQEAAKKSRQPIPGKLTDVFDVKLTNTVDTSQVVRYLDGLKKNAQNTVNPEDALNTIQAVQDEFVKYHGKRIPYRKAQEIKKNTGTRLRKQYGEMKTDLIEAQKQITRGIKDKLAEGIPELAELNAREAKLLNLEDIMQKAIKRIDNRDILSLGTGLYGAAGGLVGGVRMAGLAAILRATIENPMIKSKLAIAISGVQKRKGGQGKLSRLASPASRIEAYRRQLEAEMLGDEED